MSAQASHRIKALLFVGALSISLLVARSRLVQADDSRPAPVSILKVALDCLPYDRKRVTLTGAIELGFESQVICPTKEFLEGDPLNCLWLSTDDVLATEKLQKIASKVPAGTYVIADGTVSCSEHGHLSLFAAELQKITFIVDSEKSTILWDAATGN